MRLSKELQEATVEVLHEEADLGLRTVKVVGERDEENEVILRIGKLVLKGSLLELEGFSNLVKKVYRSLQIARPPAIFAPRGE